MQHATTFPDTDSHGDYAPRTFNADDLDPCALYSMFPNAHYMQAACQLFLDDDALDPFGLAPVLSIIAQLHSLGHVYYVPASGYALTDAAQRRIDYWLMANGLPFADDTD